MVKIYFAITTVVLYLTTTTTKQLVRGVNKMIEDDFEYEIDPQEVIDQEADDKALEDRSRKQGTIPFEVL